MRSGSRRDTIVPAVLLLAALAGWVALYVRLAGSYHGMYPATGVVAALADGVLRGQSPGHDDGTTLLAGFYFPPYASLVAAMRATGLSWLGALRAAAAIGGVLVLWATGALAAALGSRGRGVLIALALAAIAYPFKDSVMSSRSDLLAAAAALAGLAAWTRDRELRGWAAPLFAAVSFLCKFTSISLPAGIVLVALAQRRPGPLVRFAWRMALASLVGVAVQIPLHGPQWYFDVVHALFHATPGTFDYARGPLELVRYLGTFPELLWTTAVTLAVLASPRAEIVPARAFAAVSLLVTTYLMTNFGAGPNHLLEPAMLTAALAASWAGPRLGRSMLPMALVVLSVVGATWRDLVPAIRHAAEPVNRRDEILAVVAHEPGAVLTEDPLLSLAAGRRAFSSDPGALRSLSMAHDSRAEKVLGRIEAGTFPLVVTNDDLDASARWYANVHLGPRVVAALKAHYVDTGTVGGYHLLRPRGNTPR